MAEVALVTWTPFRDECSGIRAHAVPGHTLGSTIYEVSSLVDSGIASAAFTGDTLFCGGCGALFEASASVMSVVWEEGPAPAGLG